MKQQELIQHFNRNNVKKRLLDNFRNSWSKEDIEINYIDPVLMHFFESVAFEMENSLQKVLTLEDLQTTHLIDLLLPTPLQKPFTSLLRLNPNEEIHTSEIEFHSKFMDDRKTPIVLTPVFDTVISPLKVKFLAYHKTLYEINHSGDGFNQTVHISNINLGKKLYVGFEKHEMKPDIMLFFIDLGSESKQKVFVDNLSLSSTNTQSRLYKGLQPLKRLGRSNIKNQDLIRQVCTYYNHLFFSLENPEFKSSFDALIDFELQGVKGLNTDYQWVSFEIPEYILHKSNVFLSANTIPVANFHKRQFNARIREGINIIGMPDKSAFYSIEEVVDDNDNALVEVDKLNDDSTYKICTNIDRLGERRAATMIRHIKDLILDENQAFRALNVPQLESILKSLEKDLNILEKTVAEMATTTSDNPYILVKSKEKARFIYVNYLNSNGLFANIIKRQPSLFEFNIGSLKEGDIHLLEDFSYLASSQSYSEIPGVLEKAFRSDTFTTVNNIKQDVFYKYQDWFSDVQIEKRLVYSEKKLKLVNQLNLKLIRKIQPDEKEQISELEVMDFLRQQYGELVNKLEVNLMLV